MLIFQHAKDPVADTKSLHVILLSLQCYYVDFLVIFKPVVL